MVPMDLPIYIHIPQHTIFLLLYCNNRLHTHRTPLSTDAPTCSSQCGCEREVLRSKDLASEHKISTMYIPGHSTLTYIPAGIVALSLHLIT